MTPEERTELKTDLPMDDLRTKIAGIILGEICDATGGDHRPHRRRGEPSFCEACGETIRRGVTRGSAAIKADAILALPELKGVEEEGGSDGALQQPPGSGREDAPSSGSIDWKGRAVELADLQVRNGQEIVRKVNVIWALARALRDLREACFQADCAEELSEHIDGSLLDAAGDALRLVDPALTAPPADGAARVHSEAQPQQRSEPLPSSTDTPLGGWRPDVGDLREVLGWFLDDERFQIGVGGNPIAVDRMISEARHRYDMSAPPEQSGDA